MNAENIKEIVIIGAGNLATHLSLQLQKSGLIINQIYSRTEKNAKALANLLNVEYTCDIKSVAKADMYIFAVSDGAIAELLVNFRKSKSILVHTAGSVNVDVFKGVNDNYGVFYPLQTFSKSINLDFENIPICIEANKDDVKDKLLHLGRKISSKVHLILSPQRQQLHLAAVFVCNFTNHMYTIGEKLLEKENMDFSLLHELISETAKKVQTLKPKEAQTGPAIRYDKKTLNKHHEMLNDKANLQKIYKFVSDNIYMEHKK